MPDDNLPEKVTTLWRVVFGDPDTGEEGDHKTLRRHDKLINLTIRLAILAGGILIGLGILNFHAMWELVSHIGAT